MALKTTRRRIVKGLGGMMAAHLGLAPHAGFAMGPALSRQPRFYVPDEALPHARTFMQWPVNLQVHPDRNFREYLQNTIARIANVIVDFEPVVMLMAAEHERQARRVLSDSVEVWPIPTDDLWARDSGPLFVVDQQGGLAIRQMNFNGWGNKQVHTSDGQIAARVAEYMELPLLDNGLVGEPGGVETDGDGLGLATLLAHESSWINPNRNAGDKEQIEAQLLEAYGAGSLIWAPGLAGEDITDYHIDSLARFAGPAQVLIQLPADHDPNDIWNDTAYQTHDVLADARDSRGRALNVHIINEPERPRVRAQDFVASYVNYYVCNGAVICAQFGDTERDRQAQTMLERLYPQREIIALNVDALGEIGGGIHCATREQPAT